MLQHEQPVPQTNTTAAEARVTPEELSAALKTLEDKQNSTVAIGSVVDELRLNATPEQIWEQVQKQREGAQRAQATAQTPPVQAVVVSPVGAGLSQHPFRRPRWLIIVGIGLISAGAMIADNTAHNSGGVTTSGQTVTISGDMTKGQFQVQGKDVEITGDDDKITLQGQARSVTVSGDNAHLDGDEPKAFQSTGDHTVVNWTPVEPHPVAPRPPSP